MATNKQDSSVSNMSIIFRNVSENHASNWYEAELAQKGLHC